MGLIEFFLVLVLLFKEILEKKSCLDNDKHGPNQNK